MRLLEARAAVASVICFNCDHRPHVQLGHVSVVVLSEASLPVFFFVHHGRTILMFFQNEQPQLTGREVQIWKASGLVQRVFGVSTVDGGWDSLREQRQEKNCCVIDEVMQ